MDRPPTVQRKFAIFCISLRDLPDPGPKNPGASQEVQRVLAADLPGLQVVGETTGETARILRLTEGRIRQMLLAGELEGTRDPVSDRWRIPQAAVHVRKEERAPQELARSASDPREWIEKVGELRQELGRMQGRLELTEVAESTLREQLQRERERADRLEAELRDERSRGFWARLFGG